MSTFWNRIAVATSFAFFAVVFGGSCHASILTFNNRAAWEAAVGSFYVQNFEAFAGSQTEGPGVDVGDFTVRQVGIDYGGDFSQVSVSAGALQGINDGAAVGGATASGGTGMNFTYDFGISSWGADLGGFSDGPRSSAIRIGGVDYSIAFQQAFFGYIDTMNSFSSVDVVFLSGAPDGVALDNVSYSSGQGVVPEPGTLAIWAVLGLAGGLVRRRKS